MTRDVVVHGVPHEIRFAHARADLAESESAWSARLGALSPDGAAVYPAVREAGISNSEPPVLVPRRQTRGKDRVMFFDAQSQLRQRPHLDAAEVRFAAWVVALQGERAAA